jgi:hypothetical protein
MTDDILASNIISQPSCFIRGKALFDIGLLDESLHYTMDWDLWIRLFNSGAIFHYLPEVLSVVEWDTQTKTASLSRRRYSEIFSLRRKYASVSASAKTSFSFLLEHMSQYGILRPIFSRLLNHLKRRQKMPVKRWVARGVKPALGQKDHTRLHVLLSHYGDAPVKSAQVSFSEAVERQFYIDDMEIMKSEDLTVNLPLNLMPGKTYNLYITSEGDVEQSLTSVELMKAS